MHPRPARQNRPVIEIENHVFRKLTFRILVGKFGAGQILRRHEPEPRREDRHEVVVPALEASIKGSLEKF